MTSSAAQLGLSCHHERPTFFALFTHMGTGAAERGGVSLQVCGVTRDKSPCVSTVNTSRASDECVQSHQRVFFGEQLYVTVVAPQK